MTPHVPPQLVAAGSVSIIGLGLVGIVPELLVTNSPRFSRWSPTLAPQQVTTRLRQLGNVPAEGRHLDISPQHRHILLLLIYGAAIGLLGATYPLSGPIGIAGFAVITASAVAVSTQTSHTTSEQHNALEDENERLQKFACMVSHDIRSPMQSLSGHLALAQEDQSNEHIERCQTEVDRMETLLNGLEELTDIHCHEEQQAERHSLRAHAKTVWDRLPTDNATLNIDIDERTTVHINESHFHRLLENLFRNALDHAGDDVTVYIGSLDTNGFYVADDGPGIPQDQESAIFQHGTTFSETGTGYGLTIVQQVCDVYDWRLTLDRSRASGAAFAIKFT